MDIKINNEFSSLSFGDAVFVNGPLTTEGVTVKPAEVVAQRLYIRLRSYLGEWFINTAYGVPYFQSILGKKISRPAVDLIFQEQILSENGVKEIISFKSTLEQRRYSVNFTVKVVTGETVSVGINPV